MPIAIKIENLSKKYIIGHQRQAGYVALRDVIADNTRRFASNVLHACTGRPAQANPYHEELWALKDVSFEIKQGDRVGIIGRNGAGKTTLLKIISRVTEPTAGKVSIKGRVASLLEVGTGFHPELTGRENIFLNGAILGMSRAEIKKKFDEIVAFAETEKFLDTPVKKYSSGMYVRLAFAVAVHVDPEVLLVDEVLAVGDAVFHTKCLAKMREITDAGRTVLFVSHNLAAVGSVCERAIVLDAGRILFAGPVKESIDFYEQEVFSKKYLKVPAADRSDRSGSGDIRLTGFRMEDESGRAVDKVLNGRTIRLVFSYETAAAGAKNVDFGIIVGRVAGDKSFQFCTRFSGDNFTDIFGAGSIVCTIKRFPLAPGHYRIGTYFLAESSPADFITELANLDVVDGDFYGSNYQVYEKETPFLVDGIWTREALP